MLTNREYRASSTARSAATVDAGGPHFAWGRKSALSSSSVLWNTGAKAPDKPSPDETFNIIIRWNDFFRAVRINLPAFHRGTRGTIMYCLYSRRPVAECRSRDFSIYVHAIDVPSSIECAEQLCLKSVRHLPVLLPRFRYLRKAGPAVRLPPRM